MKLGHNVCSREVVGGEFLWIEPKPEGDLPVAEVGDISDSLHPLDVVGEVLVEISTNRLYRVFGLGGIFVDKVVNEQDRVGCLVDRDTRLAYFLGELRLSQGNAVLNVHLVDVAVGAALE